MNVPAYLDRIGYTAPVAAGSETLYALHRTHLLNVPFENLDIHTGREIVLDEARLFDKIVGHRRGGFCYELNGLFAWLLRELGFRVTLLAAGVANETGRFSPEFDHLTLLVETGERYLADVGFGECFLDPMPLDRPAEGEYRLARAVDHWTLLRGDKPQYRFTLTPRTLSDYIPRCRYHQTSPESHFTQGRVITRATPGGRITLTDKRLIVTRDGLRQEQAVASLDQFQALCAEYFGITALKE